jgi:oligopeptidase B
MIGLELFNGIRLGYAYDFTISDMGNNSKGSHEFMVNYCFDLGLGKSRSEQYLFIRFSSTESSEWRYADANDPKLNFRPVLPREPHLLYEVEHLGRDFVLRTNHEAPNFRIVRAPIETSADKHTWRDVLPHRTDTFLEDFEVAAKHPSNERSGGLLKIRVMPSHGTETSVGNLIDAREPAYAMHWYTPGIDSPAVRYTYSSPITPRDDLRLRP